MLFEDPEFESHGTRTLFQAPFGGAEFGECLSTAAAISEGDRESWAQEWTATAERVLAQAEESAAAGRSVSASDSFLRASSYYRTATPFLYGAPVSERLRELSARSDSAFARAMELGEYPAERLEIPFEAGSLPGWLIRSDPDQTRPLLIGISGYDSLIGELWLSCGQAAVRRGYHALLFDGPGQGAALIERGLHLRPDWETVVGAVIDHALELPGIDAERVAVSGWSLGGYLAPRAASGDSRIKAVVADPGLRGMIDAMAPLMHAFGLSPEQAADLAQLDEEILDATVAKILEIPAMRWSMEQRGPMVHGTDSTAGYLRTLPAYTLSGRVESIRCPVLLTAAEGDPLASTAAALCDELSGPKRLQTFTNAEAAGGHCEMQLRNRVHQVCFDWLDEVLL